jgi:nicotinamide riboside transporter PnuC
MSNRFNINEEKFTNTVKIQSKNIAKIVLGIIFTFLCSLTLGNTPYAFAGYGLSAFALFLIGYIFSRREAIIAYIIGLVFATLYSYIQLAFFCL